MLEIIVPKNEVYIVRENRFVTVQECKLTLEHSLISVAKWEAKWHTPYLDGKKKPAQEIDYIRCMTVGPPKDPAVYSSLSDDNLDAIKSYIDDTMTATVFSKRKTGKKSARVFTAENIYARMFANNIPMECQKWHLNRLLTLIRVCDESNTPPKKMSKRETASYYAEQNALRRAKYKTRG